MNRRFAIQVALVFLLALAVKFVYLHERLQLPDLLHPTMDSRFHDEWAIGLASGRWTPDLAKLQHEPYFRAPLYPYFAGLVYRVFGYDPAMLLRIQAIIGSMSVALVFLLTRQLFGTIVAWIAAALHVGYWPLTYHDAERLLEVIAIPLNIAVMVLLVSAACTRRVTVTLLAGICLGASAITRPTILVVAPLAVVWLWKRLTDRRQTHVGAFAIAACLVILPVTLRNAVIGKDFVLIASQGGVNFFIGNNAESDGLRAVVPGTPADWWGGYYATRRIAENAIGRPLRPSEVSRYWYRRAAAFLANEPKLALRLYVRKAALLLGNSEVSNERQLYFRRDASKTLSHLRVNFALLLAGAVVGAIGSVRSVRSDGESFSSRLDQWLPYLCGFVYAIAILAFFVSSRHRLPLAVFLIPGCAHGLSLVIQSASARNWRRLGAYGAPFLVVLALSLWNPLHVGELADARGHYSLGVDEFRNENYRAAIDELNASLREDDRYAPTWRMRGWARARLDSVDAAIEDLRRACALDSSQAESFFRLGVVLQMAGRHAEAEPLYLRCIRLEPNSVQALNNLADVYLRQDRVDEALPYLRRALAADSTFPNALYGLGYYHERKGNLTAAREAYARIPDFPPARARMAVLRDESYRGPPRAP
ncbi:MAG: tetratricopeptide repeat protein [Candidatus Latescibacteria bacterium]|nr:tetratricopeptide repeat protein [Candidatus Latescibacterota bacterium]